MSIERAMIHGASLYQESLRVLEELGLSASFTQTGGMCAALEVNLERGQLLIIDVDDSLPWDPTQRKRLGRGALSMRRLLGRPRVLHRQRY